MNGASIAFLLIMYATLVAGITWLFNKYPEATIILVFVVGAILGVGGVST